MEKEKPKENFDTKRHSGVGHTTVRYIAWYMYICIYKKLIEGWKYTVGFKL